MAKTALNKKVDDFFKKNHNVPITEKTFEKSGLNINEINEYGNLLHAAVNYDYDKAHIMQFIDIKRGENGTFLYPFSFVWLYRRRWNRLFLFRRIYY